MKTRTPGWQEHHFPCDCGDWHYLEVSIDDADPQWRFLTLVDSYVPHRWRDRLKGAWMMLRGAEHCHRGVLLDLANAADLKAVIDKLVD